MRRETTPPKKQRAQRSGKTRVHQRVRREKEAKKREEVVRAGARQDSRPPAGEARDGGRGEEEEEVVRAGARQDSRPPAGEARHEGGGGSHSRSRTRRKRPSGSKRKGLRLPGKRRRISPDLRLDGGVGQHAQGFALAREEEEKMAPGEGEKSRACRRTTKTHAHRRAGIMGRGRR